MTFDRNASEPKKPQEIDQGASDFGKELRKLVGPAIAVLESLLTNPDPKIKAETAKWILSSFPETAPKKAKDISEGGSVVNQFNVQNVNFAMEKIKHMAAGARRLENAEFSIIPSNRKKTIHSERSGGARDDDSNEVRESDS